MLLKNLSKRNYILIKAHQFISLLKYINKVVEKPIIL